MASWTWTFIPPELLRIIVYYHLLHAICDRWHNGSPFYIDSGLHNFHEHELTFGYHARKRERDQKRSTCGLLTVDKRTNHICNTVLWSVFPVSFEWLSLGGAPGNHLQIPFRVSREIFKSLQHCRLFIHKSILDDSDFTIPAIASKLGDIINMFKGLRRLEIVLHNSIPQRTSLLDTLSITVNRKEKLNAFELAFATPGHKHTNNDEFWRPYGVITTTQLFRQSPHESTVSTVEIVFIDKTRPIQTANARQADIFFGQTLEAFRRELNLDAPKIVLALYNASNDMIPCERYIVRKTEKSWFELAKTEIKNKISRWSKPGEPVQATIEIELSNCQ